MQISLSLRHEFSDPSNYVRSYLFVRYQDFCIITITKIALIIIHILINTINNKPFKLGKILSI